jgi:hypothetical protein
MARSPESSHVEAYAVAPCAACPSMATSRPDLAITGPSASRTAVVPGGVMPPMNVVDAFDERDLHGL